MQIGHVQDQYILDTNAIIDTDDYTRSTDRSGVLAELVEKYGEFPTADKAAVLLLNIIDDSTREKDGGQFINIDGSRPAW